jgi:hypothetical protein
MSLTAAEFTFAPKIWQVGSKYLFAFFKRYQSNINQRVYQKKYSVLSRKPTD